MVSLKTADLTAIRGEKEQYGETLAICERANDMDYIVEVKREK